MFSYLLVIHALIAAALVGVILMQKSEGGGFAGGGSPAGLMSARGAADFLTRTTAILAGLFVIMSIGMAAMAGISRKSGALDESLKRPVVTAPAQGTVPEQPAVPVSGQPGPVQMTPEQQAAMVKQQQQIQQQQQAAYDAQKRQFLEQQKAQEAVRRAAQPKLVLPKLVAPTVGTAAPKVTKIERVPVKPVEAPAAVAPTPPAPAAGGNSTP
ncbi:MAG: hypothetical protein RL367_1324 [Pseudomonadota bacterium]|jgi:preprotein translocase subunit SecG